MNPNIEATVYMVGLYGMSVEDAATLMKILARSRKISKDYDVATRSHTYSFDPDLNVELKLLSVPEQATLKLAME